VTGTYRYVLMAGFAILRADSGIVSLPVLFVVCRVQHAAYVRRAGAGNCLIARAAQLRFK